LFLQKIKLKEKKMQNIASKIVAIAICILMLISIGATTQLLQNVRGATTIQTYSYVNVAPNPIGLGQAVTVDFWLAVPLQTSERAVNMTVLVTDPDGIQSTLGPFISDVTGGTFTLFTPTKVGNYTFQMFYGGQTLSGGSYTGIIESPSHSDTVSLLVQTEPVAQAPFTPLPTQWWQTPANAQNVQNWYKITGPWLGLGVNAFAACGTYNLTGNYNPYTFGPTTAHILWTKPWAFGGVAGGDAGGTETSNYWSTSQYEPKFAPVVINGFLYATQYPGSTQNPTGIVCTSLYNGQTQWIINTTNPLRCGQVVWYVSPNQFGAIAYIWTTGNLPGVVNAPGNTEWNMYDAMTGNYVLSVVNGSSMQLTTDPGGDLIGYFINSTAGTQVVNGQKLTTTGPQLCEWNSTLCINPGSQWSPTNNGQIAFSNGLVYKVPMPTNITDPTTGVTTQISPALSGGNYLAATGAAFTCNSGVIMLTSGMGSPSGGETAGWVIEAGFRMSDGALLWIYNRTETAWTRLMGFAAGNGVYIDLNQATFVANGYYLQTGKPAWSTTLTVNGNPPNTYDEYDFNSVTANGILYCWGLVGDVFAINMATGHIIWATTTSTLVGDPGLETPYGIWPLWVFTCGVVAGQNGLLYLSEGHEYSPPLFHGASQLCINATTGKLVWNILAFDTTAQEVSYNIMTTLNAYDNQIYAYGQGPTKTTVSAPDTVATVGEPVVIRGTVTDVSAGTQQQAVASNFPNGLPAVSDSSMTQWMEYVYMQQPHPTNTTGVPVTISVLDSNNNQRPIGTTTTDASGAFSFTWKPDIPGNFIVTATFGGSGAYFGSYGETSMYASNPPSTPVPTATTASNFATTTDLLLYIVSSAIAIIIAIAIVGLLILRKHP
jgi:hypothetical protein